MHKVDTSKLNASRQCHAIGRAIALRTLAESLIPILGALPANHAACALIDRLAGDSVRLAQVLAESFTTGDQDLVELAETESGVVEFCELVEGEVLKEFDRLDADLDAMRERRDTT